MAVIRSSGSFRFLPTLVHGALDYSGSLVFAALPSLTGAVGNGALACYGLAVFVFLYALLTKFELGVLRLIPMKTHLALDAAWGLASLACAILIMDAPTPLRLAFLGLGLVGVTASLITKTEPAR